MKTLALLRHAESDRSKRRLGDFERPLSPGGVAAARRIGRAMRARGLEPGLVLCSEAVRARQTWDLIAPELSRASAVQCRRYLYLAAPGVLLEAVRRVDAPSAAVLMIGHNPGLGSLAAALGGPGSDPEAQRALAREFPTAALAVLTFDTSRWRDIAPGQGKLTAVLCPQDLE